jgi:Flp pilus assembly secretin CpaC
LFKRTIAATLAATSIALVAQAPAHAARPDIVIPHGQTTVFSVPEGVERVVTGDASVAEVVVLPGQNRDILINAKNPGFTNFLVWGARGGPPRNYKLEVLSARRDEVIAVRIEVLEVTNRDTGNVGVRWNDQLGFAEAPPSAPFRVGLPMRTEVLNASVKMLAQDRDVKVLARPTLVIQSGKKGSFLAGGELPIPLMQAGVGGTSYSVEWKQFGIKLDVAPRLEGNDNITLDLRPEVSNVDQENSIQLQNLVVPAISTRWTQTSVTLNNGESIVIAGLMRTEKFRVSSKVPFLGDIPIVGYLFGSAQYDERTSELVFVVTPTVVTNNQVVPEQNYGGRNNPSPPPKK